jgi:hypothetical protein
MYDEQDKNLTGLCTRNVRWVLSGIAGSVSEDDIEEVS